MKFYVYFWPADQILTKPNMLHLYYTTITMYNFQSHYFVFMTTLLMRTNGPSTSFESENRFC